LRAIEPGLLHAVEAGRRSRFQGPDHQKSTVKTTRYFEMIRSRADRAPIRDEWLQRAIDSPEHESIQADGRVWR